MSRLKINPMLEQALRYGASRAKVSAILNSNGAKLNQAMTRRAFFTKGYSKGDTRRSIVTRREDQGLVMRSVTKPFTEYSPYLEQGTSKMDAQPFVEPALEDVKEGFINDLRKSLLIK